MQISRGTQSVEVHTQERSQLECSESSHSVLDKWRTANHHTTDQKLEGRETTFLLKKRCYLCAYKEFVCEWNHYYCSSIIIYF
ncbi:hypothetical protein FKM82_027076 [Ascaphus truei]